MLTKSPPDTRVIFIPTAADPYPDKWFIEADKKQWQELGFNILELDLKGKKERELRNLLKGFDIVYIAGGNTFYLLEKVLESGFDVVIKELLENGVIYAGGSAGAIIAGPTIEPIRVFDDLKAAPNLKSYAGLGLVDFIVLPHYSRDKLHNRQHDQIIKEWNKKGYMLIPLTNDQAIVVEGNDSQVVDLT